MAGPNLTEQGLIKTTRTVARVLSSDFGIKNGYEAVDTQARPESQSQPLPLLAKTPPNKAAEALAALFAQQDPHAVSESIQRTTVMSESQLDLKIGDVVEVALGASNRLMLVVAVRGEGFRGIQLLLGSETILHGLVAANEVFASVERMLLWQRMIVATIDPSSIILRYGWDDKRAAFLGLQDWAAQMSWDLDDPVYHEGDFVLLQRGHDNPLIDIAQVQSIDQQSISVRHLLWQTLDAKGFRHDRLLSPVKELKQIERTSFKPIATCSVSLLPDEPSWYPDEFFVTQEGASLLRPECDRCKQADRQHQTLRHSLGKLRSMEIMCGAGGLSLGLGLSSACETNYAIDADFHSTQTFKNHHPDAKVFCCDAGDALAQAVSGKRYFGMPRFPSRGEVDLIAAGPPCQGFSRKNKTACREAANEDLRNLLVCTVLGWVEHLHPKYFVLENVEGFTSSKLGGHEQGMVKLVTKILLELGYASTCGFVQSGAYGCPQSRGRFLLLAARADVTLPSLPTPTHHFLGNPAHAFSWTDGHGASHAAAQPQARPVLLPAVTVLDAIDDLPRFDWKDPHVQYDGPDQIELEREASGIPQLEVVTGKATGFATAAYRTTPSTSYQERMRIIAGRVVKTATQHQTSGFGDKPVERVVNVALRPGADYDSWSQPEVKKPDLLDPLQLNRWQDREFKFERIDVTKYFKALLTEATASGSMIHPTQRRLFTVRECARAQGFPDWVDFATDGNMKSAYKQIGNAVPVPLAVAIGKSIVAARLRDEEKHNPPPAQHVTSFEDPFNKL